MNKIICLRVLHASAFETLGPRQVLQHCWGVVEKLAARYKATPGMLTTTSNHARVQRLIRTPVQISLDGSGADTAIRSLLAALDIRDDTAVLLVEARYPFLTSEKLSALLDCVLHKKAAIASLGRPAQFCSDTQVKFVNALGGLVGVRAQVFGNNARGATVLPVGPLEAVDVTEPDGMKIAMALVE